MAPESRRYYDTRVANPAIRATLKMGRARVAGFFNPRSETDMATKATPQTPDKANGTPKDGPSLAEQKLAEATEQARERLVEAAQRAEAAVREGIETIRAHGQAYSENAGEQFEAAQRYVTERVRERPVTSALACLGVGMLIGLLLANRGGRD